MKAILAGREAAAARGALEALSVALLATGPRHLRTPDLAWGLSGLALAHATLDRAMPGNGHAARAARRTSQAIAVLAERPTTPSLFEGFVGVAWVAEHLFGGGEEDVNAEVDAALSEIVAEEGPFDLHGGLLGTAVYALERGARGGGLLDGVVSRLARTAVRTREGIAWRTRAEWLSPFRRRTEPYPWQIGVARGAAGIVAALAGVAASPHAARRTRERAARLLEGAVAWLLARELPRGARGRFAIGAGSSEPAPPAWCRGDEGIAAALLAASRATRERRWERHAMRIALSAAARDPRDFPMVDSGLCHGAAGVAHVFRRLYVETGERRFAAASRAWIVRLLATREARGGFAGFRARMRDPRSDEPRYIVRPVRGWLLGGAGIAMALAVALDLSDDAGWDRLLLLHNGSQRAL